MMERNVLKNFIIKFLKQNNNENHILLQNEQFFVINSTKRFRDKLMKWVFHRNTAKWIDEFSSFTNPTPVQFLVQQR